MFFFLQEVVKIQKNWVDGLNSLPETKDQQQRAAMWKAAGGDRLEVFKSFNVVDMLVKAYPVYSHDDIEQLTWQMVNTMIAYNKIYAYILSKDNENK